MAIDDFLRTYQQSLSNKKIVSPLPVANNSSLPDTSMGIKKERRGIIQPPTMGPQIPSWLDSRKSTALNKYMSDKNERTSELASDYADKAAGQVPVNEWGIVQEKMTDFVDYFNKQLGAIGDRGKAALATEEAKAHWQFMQNQAEMNAGYQVNWAPGASGDNKGAKAVSLAMTAAQRGVPYVWGGNSLTRGVDCSGLVQQVYKQMGISLPRTTYEQAKRGKVVSTGALLPGDLVFYNTGGRDPNGIGSLSHVGIYIGNGKIVHAPGRGRDVTVASINNPGRPARAVRPW